MNGAARTGTAAERAYVAIVVLLGAGANIHSEGVVVWAWITALVVALPSIIVFIPAVYVLVPIAWWVDDTVGGAWWVVVVAYGVCFAGAAVANVLLLRRVRQILRQRRHDRAVGA